jgi:hypothetical protein
MSTLEQPRPPLGDAPPTAAEWLTDWLAVPYCLPLPEEADFERPPSRGIPRRLPWPDFVCWTLRPGPDKVDPWVHGKRKKPRRPPLAVVDDFPAFVGVFPWEFELLMTRADDLLRAVIGGEEHA